ncbi:MAG: hypothetical protein J6U54_12605 [Clostridiales bacterium]|nr:hypothetical protein [Clostridiales bacterium]
MFKYLKVIRRKLRRKIMTNKVCSTEYISGDPWYAWAEQAYQKSEAEKYKGHTKRAKFYDSIGRLCDKIG